MTQPALTLKENMVTRKMPPRRQRIWAFLQEFYLDNGIPPTVRDIQKACEISSTSVVDYNLEKLKEAGYINRRHDVARGIEILDQEGEPISNAPRVQILGLIAAGEPIEALENPEMVDVPPSLLHPDHYVLQVKGDSMIDEQIHDGDFIVARKAKTARSGQIVVALINGEATLKCYVPKSNGVELHPRNPDFPVIRVNSQDDFHINGVLLYSFRNYLN